MTSPCYLFGPDPVISIVRQPIESDAQRIIERRAVGTDLAEHLAGACRIEGLAHGARGVGCAGERDAGFCSERSRVRHMVRRTFRGTT